MRLPDRIKKLMQKFIAAKAEIYVVGGAVRDSLMKRKVKDWDFTTNLTPEEMKKLFPKNSFYNNQFGTLSVVEGKNIYEITTYRTEQGYSDARHPDQVSWGLSLEEDLMRRDFTVNAMAADIDGKVVDPYKGQEDLEKRLIRAVGKAEERFEEDALRMMRAIRIACQIGFVIEELTFEAIEKNCQKISKVSAERVRDELLKILGSPARLREWCG